MAKKLKQMGNTNFTTGSILYDLIGDGFSQLNTEFTKEEIFLETHIDQLKFESFISDLTMEMVRDKLNHIKSSIEFNHEIFEQIKEDIKKVPFNLIARNNEIKRQVRDILTYTQS